MVMLGLHYLDKRFEYDQIHFPSQESHPDTTLLIGNYFSQGFQDIQEDVFEFNDPIYNQMEASYLASPFSRNKF